MAAGHRLSRGGGHLFIGSSSAAFVALLLITAVPAAPLKPRSLGEGSQSGVRAPLKRAFRTAAEWDGFRARYLKGARLAGVDWKREMVLAVFLGERPSSGYRLRISSAEVTQGKLKVLPGSFDGNVSLSGASKQ